MSKQWTICGRFTFDGWCTVEAETVEEAKAKFNSGDFEFNAATASCLDWKTRGQPTED